MFAGFVLLLHTHSTCQGKDRNGREAREALGSEKFRRNGNRNRVRVRRGSDRGSRKAVQSCNTDCRTCATGKGKERKREEQGPLCICLSCFSQGLLVCMIRPRFSWSQHRLCLAPFCHAALYKASDSGICLLVWLAPRSSIRAKTVWGLRCPIVSMC